MPAPRCPPQACRRPTTTTCRTSTRECGRPPRRTHVRRRSNRGCVRTLAATPRHACLAPPARTPGSGANAQGVWPCVLVCGVCVPGACSHTRGSSTARRRRGRPRSTLATCTRVGVWRHARGWVRRVGAGPRPRLRSGACDSSCTMHDAKACPWRKTTRCKRVRRRVRALRPRSRGAQPRPSAACGSAATSTEWWARSW